jgi:hypothetical protein
MQEILESPLQARLSQSVAHLLTASTKAELFIFPIFGAARWAENA